MTSEDFFDNIQQHYNRQLPFVAYRKPNEAEVKALLQKDDSLNYVKYFTENGFVFAPFDDREHAVLIPIENSEGVKTDSVIPANPSSYRERIPSIESELLSDSKEHHISLVQSGIDAITSGYFQKVVVSRKETVNYSEANSLQLFKRLLNAYTSAFVYCWYHPKTGLWLGATPETFLKIDGKRLSTMALAGTQVYKGTLDVHWEDKEKAEQQFVTDYLEHSLKALTERIYLSETKTVKAGNLLHLQTNISGFLKEDQGIDRIISVLHPTPAVCGLPKNTTKQFILENENYKREFYTGFLGELNLKTTMSPRSSRRNIEDRAYTMTRNTTQLFVNLRCMQLQESKAIIYVGGGITKDSVPENEWEETVNKSLVMKNIL